MASKRPAKRPGSPAGHRRQAAIGAAIHGFRRAFAAFHRLMAASSGHKVSTADAFALQFIAHTGGATPGEIGAFTGLTSGAVTTMLDRLEAAGFVRRERSPADRRVVRVRLRPGAHQAIFAMMLGAHEAVGRMFDGWDVDRIERLVDLLDELGLDAPG